MVLNRPHSLDGWGNSEDVIVHDQLTCRAQLEVRKTYICKVIPIIPA